MSTYVFFLHLSPVLFLQFSFLSLYLRLLYPAALNTLSTFQNISPLAITNIFFSSLVYHRFRLFLTPDDFKNSKLSPSHVVPFPTIVLFLLLRNCFSRSFSFPSGLTICVTLSFIASIICPDHRIFLFVLLLEAFLNFFV